MSKTSATIAIALAAFIGAMSGYWFRGQVPTAQQQLAHQQGSPWAFTTGPPPQVLELAPPTGVRPGYPGATSEPAAK
jgi:hypothetical protein